MPKRAAKKKKPDTTDEKPGCIAENGTCGRRPTVAKGLCGGHYRRQWLAEKNGTKADLSTPIEGDGPVWELVSAPKVPPHVADHLKKVSDANGTTVYATVQEIIFDWYERSTGKSAM